MKIFVWYKSFRKREMTSIYINELKAHSQEILDKHKRSSFAKKFIPSIIEQFDQKGYISNVQAGYVNGHIEEHIEGQKVVKVFNHEKIIEADFAVLNDRLQQSGTEANTFANILGPIMGNFSHIQYAFVSILGAFFFNSGC